MPKQKRQDLIQELENKKVKMTLEYKKIKREVKEIACEIESLKTPEELNQEEIDRKTRIRHAEWTELSHDEREEKGKMIVIERLREDRLREESREKDISDTPGSPPVYVLPPDFNPSNCLPKEMICPDKK